MDRERWKRIEPILDRALELRSEERADYLAEACAGDAELRDDIEALIAADRRTRGPLDDRTEALTLALDESSAALPEEIGGYVIEEMIGQGGMGVVYRAIQRDPRRFVALKVVRAGMDRAAVLERFEVERQALGMMDHPNIAQVFDAGSTAQQLPFFVMEYVDGEPITDYCDRNGLGTRQRLDLFMQVCAAVQHAHHKGIVHRDLKPSNVLVAKRDGRPVPKVIDFGIAKAIDRELAVSEAFTESGQLIGTPAYMSPEQATLVSEAVDTRTDVYSLGVLLYVLLVGLLPFSPEELRRAGFDEMRRIIRETDPPRPSSRLRDLDPTQTTDIGRSRAIQADSLARQIEGELDWVVLRALEKDPERRYGSPEFLADDLRRFLNHEPVQARPTSGLYRMRKFTRRHRVGVGIAAAASIGVVVFAATMSWQAARIARERDRADVQARTATRALDFLVDVFEISDPGEAQGTSLTAREILERGAERVSAELDDEPEVRATLLRTIGRVRKNLGLLSDARPLLEESLQLHIRHLGSDHRDTLGCLYDLAELTYEQGRLEEAAEHARELVARSRRALGERDRDTLGSLALLGLILLARGDPEEAEGLLRESVAGLEATLGGDHSETLSARNDLAYLLGDVGRLEESVQVFEALADSFARVLGEDHPTTLMALNNAGVLAQRQGDYERAEALIRRVLESRRRVLGEEHPDTLVSINNLADLYGVQQRFDEAEPLFRKAMEGRSRALGPDHPQTLQAYHNLGVFMWNRKDLERAEPLGRHALEGRLRSLGPAHRDTLSSQRFMAMLMEDLGRPADAERLFRDGLTAARENLGPDQFLTMLFSADVGRLLLGKGDPDRAEPFLREAMERSVEALEPTNPFVARFKRYYGQCLSRLRRFDEAETLLLEAHRALASVFPETHGAVRACAEDVAALYDAWGRPEQAEPWRVD